MTTNMTIITLIFIPLYLLLTLGLVCSIYILYRNNKVCEFRLSILDMVSQAAHKQIDQGNYDWEYLYKIFDKHSYDRMLYSFRPLKLDKWFTPDEIKLLTSKTNEL